MNNYYNMISPLSNREQTLKGIIDQASRELSALQSQQYTSMPDIQNFQFQTQIPFKVVDSLDDVNKELIFAPIGYFVAKDYTMFWTKNSKGDLREFKMEEIIKKDPKDLAIENLQKQINELKRGINNGYNKYDATNDDSKNDDGLVSNESTNVQSNSAGISKKRESKRFVSANN